MPKKKANKGERSGRTEGPAAAATSYNGPVMVPRLLKNTDLETTVLSGTSTSNFTSSGLGAIALALWADPSGFVRWTSFSVVYREFRVLAMRLSYIPYNRYNRGAVITRPFVTVLAHSTSQPAALVSYTSAVVNPSYKAHSLDVPFSVVIKMEGIEEASFMDTASPLPRSYIMGYADGLTATTSYGMAFIDITVQFKGRM